MIHPLRSALVCFAALGGCVWGCHAIVGADEFTVEEPAAGGAAGSTSSTGAGGTGGGAGGADLCHPSGLEDDFGGTDFGPLWEPWGDLDADGTNNGHGFLQASAFNSRDGGIDTLDSFDMTGCAVWVEVLQVPNPSTGAEVKFAIWVDPANHAVLGIRRSDLFYVVRVNGAEVAGNTLPYDNDEHRWLRFRDDQGQLRLEASPNVQALAWAELAAVAAPAWIDQIQVNLNLNVSDANEHVARFVFDNLNTLP